MAPLCTLYRAQAQPKSLDIALAWHYHRQHCLAPFLRPLARDSGLAYIIHVCLTTRGKELDYLLQK